MKRKYKGKEYFVRDYKCLKMKCFVPFSGNGQNICRLYELGKCPENHLNDEKTGLV
jgi:hypothetical protein